MSKSGLRDVDKILITVALWFSAVPLFAVAMTLPMLGDNVSLYYNPAAADAASSKYYNLLLILTSIIPAAIIIVASLLKKYNRLSNNFMSVVICGIMLAVCMSGIVIYGISLQLHNIDPDLLPADEVNRLDVHVLIVVGVCVLLSLVSSGLPLVFHSKRFAARAAKRSMYVMFLCRWLDRYWAIGAIGFMITAAAGAFIPGPFAYIPIGVFSLTILITALSCAYVNMKRNMEAELLYMLDR